MMDFYNRRNPKAKKQYLCEMCNKAIEIGETYSYEAGKYDGDFFDRKMHLKCFEMFSAILDEMGENEFSWDDFPDWWSDNRCLICHRYYPVCKPDETCPLSHAECPDKDNLGRCTCGETCDEMTHVGWCENFEEVVK